jgi:membrane protease YdiL (CAAX protease family)
MPALSATLSDNQPMNAAAPFLNDAGRLRSGWRVGIFVVVYAVLLRLLGIAGSGIYLITASLWRENARLEDFLFRLVLLSAGMLAGWICLHWLEGLPWRALGLTLHERWFRDLLVGSLVGAASLVIAALIALALGGLRFSFSPPDALYPTLVAMFGTALIFIVAALAEEATFRGYPLQTLTRAGLIWLGVLITSLPFAAVHLRNPNVVAGFTFVNTALAGLWLAVAYLRTRSLWFPLGVHWAWNWTQGSVFGIAVSGLHLSENSLLRASELGPAWLTGGSYGIEGGAACTVALLLSTIFIWRTRWVSSTPELKRLTSQENPAQRAASLSLDSEVERP